MSLSNVPNPYLPGDPRETLPDEVQYPLDVVERTVAVTLTQRVLVTVTVKGHYGVTDAEAVRFAKKAMAVEHGTIGHPTHPTTRPKVDALRLWVAPLKNPLVAEALTITAGADDQPFVQLEGWADGEDHIEVVEEVTRQDRDEMAEHDAADDWHDARCER